MGQRGWNAQPVGNEAGDGGSNMPMTCEGGMCDPGLVAVQQADGSLIWRHSIVSSIYSATKG